MASISEFHALEELFTRVRHLPPHARSSFLETQGKDPSLVAMVLEMVALYESEESLSRYLGPLEDCVQPPEIKSGDQIGAYKVDRQLGQGGMGQVFLAHRADGAFQRDVAIKVLKIPHLVSENFSQSREWEILSRLDHPFIAKFFDLGETASGHPYFIMEYVEGLPLDAYCNLHQLKLGARLEIFKKICRVIAFAHQNQVVHLDLKPANILVTNDGTPKVLDFGLAVVFNQNEEPLVGNHQLFLTPDFASPEHVLGHAVGPQSDLFSLGNLLYRLITGCKPYDTTNVSFERLGELFETATILPLAQAIEAFPKFPRTQDRSWPIQTSQVNHDLERVLAKTMAISPDDRYQQVSHLLEDLQEFQADQPTSAVPWSFSKKISQILRRNRIQALTAILVSIVVLSGLFFMRRGALWQSGNHTPSLPDQEAKRSTLQLLDSLVEQSKGFEGRADHPSAKDLFQTALHVVDQAPLGLSDQQAVLLETLAEISKNLGDYTTAECLLKEVLAIRKAQTSADEHSLSQVMENLGQVYWHAGALDLSEWWVMRALDLRLEQAVPSSEKLHESYQSLAVIFEMQDRLDSAEWLLTRILDQLAPKDQSRQYATTLNNLALVAQKRGQYAKAIELISEALELNRQSLGPNHPMIAKNLNNLGLFHKKNGNREAALIYYGEALEIQQKTLPADHPYLGLAMNNMATLFQSMGDLEQAEHYYRQALASLEKSLSPQHPSYLRTLNNFASLSYANGEYADAQGIFEQLLQVERDSKKPNPGNLSQTLNNLGMTHKARGQLNPARTMIEESLAIRRHHLGDDHPLLIPNLLNLAAINLAAGRCSKAREQILDAQRIIKLRSDKPSTRLAATHIILARLDMGMGHSQNAWKHLDSADRMLVSLGGDQNRYHLEAGLARVEWYARAGEKAQAKNTLKTIFLPIVVAYPMNHPMPRSAMALAKYL